MSQWVSEFAQIVREENDETVKNHMLDYLAELMEDSHDFGWQSAKGSHAVLLCRMEDNKIQWQDTHKIDRLRRVHALRVAPTPQTKRTTAKDPLVCKFYQRGSCMQKGDHENNGQPGEWTVPSTFRFISAILGQRLLSSCSISELVSMVSALALFTSLLCISTLHFEFMGRGWLPPHLLQSKGGLGENYFCKTCCMFGFKI